MDVVTHFGHMIRPILKVDPCIAWVLRKRVLHCQTALGMYCMMSAKTALWQYTNKMPTLCNGQYRYVIMYRSLEILSCVRDHILFSSYIND